MKKQFWILLLLPFCLFADGPKKALIFGVTGQDGAYLAEFLLKKGYEVHGVKRRSSGHNTERIDHLYQDPHFGRTHFFLHYGDVNDSSNVIRLLEMIRPDEIYNLAAQSHVRVSFDIPEYTANVDALGTLRILDAILQSGLQNKTRFYQASTSEMYGKIQEPVQSETTPFYPRSPYAAAKLFAYWITVNYREAYNIFGCNGILFNHESPIRGETFVTKKITQGAARIYCGIQDCIYLGNLDARRDWGFAGDYVKAMWLMLQQDQPDDYVIGTGECHSVREFVELTFQELGYDLVWEGNGIDEIGYDKETHQVLIRIDPKYYRPTEVEILHSNPNKAKEKLGWEPEKSFRELVSCMLRYDLEAAKKEKYYQNQDPLLEGEI